MSADVHQKAELSIVGFHPSTGSRQSTNFVNVLIDTHHHAPFDSNLFYKSVFVSGSYDDRYVVWKVRLQNGVDMDAGIYSINSDHTASLRDLTGPLFTPSCNDFSVIPLNSENIHMNEIAIECPGLGEYWIANIEENLSNGHVEAKNFFQIAKPQMPSAASLLSSHLPRQEFDEEVYAISRVYMLAQDNDRPYYTDCVIDIYDLRSGKDVLNLEIDLSKSKLGVGETISKVRLGEGHDASILKF